MTRFDVKFSVTERQFEIDMSDQEFSSEVHFDAGAHFDANFEAIHEVTVHKDADPYRGAYEVTPKVDEQVLQTAQKLMADDVTINAIPIYDVSNNSGGSTVYIAREV